MRIAGGVLIIIVSILNLFAGATYAIFGGAASVVGDITQQAAQQAAKQTNDPKAAKDLQTAAKQAQELGAVLGGGAVVFGFFLLAMCGLCIAAAVVLFREKAATFALVVGILQLVAEGLGFVIIPGITTVGIVIKAFVVLSAVLVIVGALSYRGKSTAVPTM